MLERYRLRLRDGTLLVVDYDALSPWLVDDRAMVQAVGSTRWRSLKQFLTEEVARPSRPRSTPNEAVPVVRKKSLEEALVPPPPRSTIESTGLRVPAKEAGQSTPDENVPIAVVPADDEPEAPRPADASAVSAPQEPLASISEPPSLWVPAEEPAPLFMESASRQPTRDEVPIVAVKPIEEKPTTVLAVQARSRRVEPPPAVKVKNPRVLAEKTATPHDRQTPAESTSSDRLATIPLKPLDKEGAAPRPHAAQPRNEPVEPPPSLKAESLQVLAEETAAQCPMKTPPKPESSDRLPTIALKPLDKEEAALLRADAHHSIEEVYPEIDVEEEEEVVQPVTKLDTGLVSLASAWDVRLTRWVAALGRWIDRLTPQHPPSPSLSRDEPARRGAASPRSSQPEPPRVSVPTVRVLAAEPTAPRTACAPERSTLDEDLASIALEQLEDDAPTRGAARTKSRAANAIDQATSRAKALLGRFHAAASPWTHGWAPRLNGWLGRLTRQVDRIIGWAGRVARRRQSPSLSPVDVVSSAASEPPRQQLKPPPSLHEMPILRFAETSEPESKHADDIYDGDDYERASFFHIAWLWLKRGVLITGLAAGVVVAVSTWETWRPKAEQIGRVVVKEIADQARSSKEHEQLRLALQAAVEQLPHLAPETIRLVMSRSAAGIPDPAEVFSRAYDAMERGMSALTPEEALELNRLRQAVLAALRTSERERFHEYDRARVRRVTFPFEDRDVLGIFARGARALPSEAQERLQALSGKAIAAALSSPPRAATRAAIAR